MSSYPITNSSVIVCSTLGWLIFSSSIEVTYVTKPIAKAFLCPLSSVVFEFPSTLDFNARWLETCVDLRVPQNHLLRSLRI